MSEPMLMKNGLAKPAIERIARSIRCVYKDFPSKKFIELALTNLKGKELRARVDHIIDSLAMCLPKSFDKTAQLLLALPAHWDKGDPNDTLRGFAIWPVTDYVARYGLESPETSLKVLKNLTPLFTSEFAIRPFIERYPKQTFSTLKIWAKSENEHHRRLASEGCRPRLPWGKRLHALVEDPTPIFKILELLKDDESEYVRKSVANNLNDIGKDHPQKVIQICQKWLDECKEKPQLDKHRRWIVSHACRSLIKQGHPDSFPLLGYTKKPKVEIVMFKIKESKIKVGQSLNFDVEIKSLCNKQSFVLDFAVHFVKANGTKSAKVFKLKNLQMDKNQIINVSKAHSFKAISTRRYYSGCHEVSIHINGNEYARQAFDLKVN